MIKSTIAILAATLAVTVLATPLMAQDAGDPAMMACKDYLTLDAEAMMAATVAFRADPMAGSMLGNITDEEAMRKIMSDCNAMPDMTLMDSMHMNM